MYQTNITILAQTVMVPGPQGPQVGVQVQLQVEGHQADDPAFTLMLLEQAKNVLYQNAIKGAAPRLQLPTGAT